MKNDLLSVKQIRYLSSAFDLMYDQIKNDITILSNNQNDKDKTWLWEILPPLGRASLNLDMAFKLLTTLITVVYKFHNRKKLLLGNIAEEIILYNVLEFARDLVKENQTPIDNYENFIGTIFEDTDFLFLYDPQCDGIETSEVGELLGINSLSPSEWFTPFNKPRKPHPFFWKSKDRLIFPANNK